MKWASWQFWSKCKNSWNEHKQLNIQFQQLQINRKKSLISFNNKFCFPTLPDVVLLSEIWLSLVNFTSAFLFLFFFFEIWIIRRSSNGLWAVCRQSVWDWDYIEQSQCESVSKSETKPWLLQQTHLCQYERLLLCTKW